ncbi:MAG: extracellular solute-binding protein, partial [Butyrivibrio sp.]|nr:extracellular solute-binding protein [Butyrivibrio sp.]
KYLISTNLAYLNNMFVNYYMKQLSGNTLFDVESGKLLANEENLAKTFSYIQALFDNNVIPPVSRMAQYEGDNLQSDPDWIAGNYVCSFTYISTAEVLTAANENAEYIAGEFPVMEGAKNDGFIIGCPQIIATSKNSEHLEEAIMFLNYFFNDDEALSILATHRSVPFTSHAREIVEKDGNLSELLSTSVDILTPYQGLANDPIGSTSEAKQIMQDAIENVAFGEMTPEEAAAEVISNYSELEK